MVQSVQRAPRLCRPSATGRTHHKLKPPQKPITLEVIEHREDPHQWIGSNPIQ